MQIVTEGLARVKVPKAKIVSKEMKVFYNPVMSVNRDISVLLLNSINKRNMQIADILAASGIRSIRFLKELSKSKIKTIFVNDYGRNSTKLIKENLKLNKIRLSSKIKLTSNDANLMMLSSNGFDYIDIDPFGTPNPFLDAACRRISREGILAVTATDTSALSGTFINACRRKYWATPRNDAVMHETGLRILIRKIQLIGMQYDKALVPVFSYSKEHYMRAFLVNEKGKSRVDEILKHHDFADGKGPLWTGQLWDRKLCKKMYSNSMKNRIFGKNRGLIKFLATIKDESKINAMPFYDLHDICGKNRIKSLPKKDFVMEKIRKSRYRVSSTHFKGEGIRSNISLKELIKILK